MPRFDLVPATEAHALELLSDISLQSSDDYASLGLDPREHAVEHLRKSVCTFAGLIDGPKVGAVMHWKPGARV